MTYNEALVKRIQLLCFKKKLTVNKLATLAGLTQSTLDNIIKGHTKYPNIRTLHRIAQGFGITIADFLDFPEMECELEDD